MPVLSLTGFSTPDRGRRQRARCLPGVGRGAVSATHFFLDRL